MSDDLLPRGSSPSHRWVQGLPAPHKLPGRGAERPLLGAGATVPQKSPGCRAWQSHALAERLLVGAGLPAPFFSAANKHILYRPEKRKPKRKGRF